MKKIVSAILFAAILLTTTLPTAYAVPVDISRDETTAFWKESDAAKGPQYHYKMEYLIEDNNHITNVDEDIFLSDQPTAGTYVGWNDSLSYVPSGSGELTVGIAYTLPGTLSQVTVSVSFPVGTLSGGYSQNGGSVGLGDGQTPGYYHLYLHRVMKIRPYVVYRKPAGTTGSWVIDHTGYTVADANYQLHPYLVRVG